MTRTKTLFCITLMVGLIVASAGHSPADARTVKVEFTAVETEVVIDNEGTKYKAWTFNGQFPGPVVRATEGDTIEFSLTNPKTNTFAHSMDFHAGEMDFLKNHKPVERGETHHITFTPKKPGIFFYHCGVQPMIQHIARGMMGAIIIDPKDPKALPKADRAVVELLFAQGGVGAERVGHPGGVVGPLRVGAWVGERRVAPGLRGAWGGRQCEVQRRGPCSIGRGGASRRGCLRGRDRVRRRGDVVEPRRVDRHDDRQRQPGFDA